MDENITIAYWLNIGNSYNTPIETNNPLETNRPKAISAKTGIAQSDEVSNFKVGQRHGETVNATGGFPK